MAAPKGNQFWKARASHGPPYKYESSDVLWTACEEYFEWNELNPLQEEKGFAFQGVVTKESFSKMRAMTIEALCMFLGISYQTWQNWKKERDDLLEVITRAEAIIRRQKFEGASADLLNPNVIARDLGLKEQTSTDLRVPEGVIFNMSFGNKA